MPSFFQRLHNPANAFVHVVNHAVVGVNVAALQMKDIVFDGLRKRMVFSSFPGPMRRCVMHAQKERLCGVLRHALHKINRVIGDQIGQIALMRLLFFAHPQIVSSRRSTMCEVINTACHGAKKLIVARPQRAKGWRISQVPLANQGCAVALLFEQRGQCGVGGGQSQGGAGSGFAVDGLFRCAPQTILIPGRHEPKSGGRTHWRIGIAVGKLQALGRQFVQDGRYFAEMRITTAVAT